jgi:hypothetical protein
MRILVLTPFQLEEAKALLQLALEEGAIWEELCEELLPGWTEEEVRVALSLLRHEPRKGLNERGG